jgi:hypothetical protein
LKLRHLVPLIRKSGLSQALHKYRAIFRPVDREPIPEKAEANAVAECRATAGASQYCKVSDKVGYDPK